MPTNHDIQQALDFQIQISERAHARQAQSLRDAIGSLKRMLAAIDLGTASVADLNALARSIAGDSNRIAIEKARLEVQHETLATLRSLSV